MLQVSPFLIYPRMHWRILDVKQTELIMGGKTSLICERKFTAISNILPFFLVSLMLLWLRDFFCHPKVARYPLTCACIALKALVAWSKENQGEARTSHLWSLHSASLQKSCETQSWLYGLYDLSPWHLCTPISDLFAICSALFINPNLCKMKPAKAFCFSAVRVHKDRQ